MWLPRLDDIYPSGSNYQSATQNIWRHLIMRYRMMLDKYMCGVGSLLYVYDYHIEILETCCTVHSFFFIPTP